jgi:Glyoxalase/Bleomycin resistance protein/Dioxygenase superfamily
MARGSLSAMIRQIAPQFFTTDLPSTLTYYKDKLGFECLGTWQDPPVYAIVARDQHRIHFRCAEPPAPNPDKTPTSSSPRTCSLGMLMRSSPNIAPAVSSLREALPTRPGTRASSS